jgi:hypothetical protein
VDVLEQYAVVSKMVVVVVMEVFEVKIGEVKRPRETKTCQRGKQKQNCATKCT